MLLGPSFKLFAFTILDGKKSTITFLLLWLFQALKLFKRFLFPWPCSLSGGAN